MGQGWQVSRLFCLGSCVSLSPVRRVICVRVYNGNVVVGVACVVEELVTNATAAFHLSQGAEVDQDQDLVALGPSTIEGERDVDMV